jgi:hypothetical protein
MRCNKIEEKILDFIEGNIEIEEKNKIEEHLRECKNCKNLYNDFLFIIDNSKKIETPKIDENFWKVKFNSIIEKEVSHPHLKLKPLYLSIPFFILIFSFVLFIKIHLPYKKSTQFSGYDYELLFSEETILKYVDYIDENEAAKIIEFILKENN